MKRRINYSEEAIDATAKLVFQMNKARPYQTVSECADSIRQHMLQLLAEEDCTMIGTAGWVILKFVDTENIDLDFYVDPLILGSY